MCWKYMDKHIYKMSDDDIMQFVKKHIPIKTNEKNKFAEVFTPQELILKMLDLIPETVWTNPSSKWLEPSSGSGFFMIFIYKKLMNTLDKWEPNRLKRSNHIIKTMLYMVELNPHNCKTCRNLFGPNINIDCNDFLSDTMKYNSISFDVIIGNPPFQNDKTDKNDKSNKQSNGKNKLYERFFIKSHRLLNVNAYLVFITPVKLFSGNKISAYKLLINSDVKYVNFNAINATYFKGVQQEMCYFILNNSSPSAESVTTIVNSSSTFKVKLLDRPVNPINNWTKESEQMIRTFTTNDKNSAVYCRGQSVDAYTGSTYTLIYAPNKRLKTDDKHLAKGFGIKKIVIFIISPKLEFEMDYDGKYGVGPNTFYIPFNNVKDGKKLEHFFSSLQYKSMVNDTKITRQFLNSALIQHLNISKIIGLNDSKTRKKSKSINIKSKKHKST